MSEPQITRATLLVRLRDGSDHMAWCDFVDLYSPVIYRFARRHGLQDADAADLVQEVHHGARREVEFVGPRQDPRIRHRAMTEAENGKRSRAV